MTEPSREPTDAQKDAAEWVAYVDTYMQNWVQDQFQRAKRNREKNVEFLRQRLSSVKPGDDQAGPGGL